MMGVKSKVCKSNKMAKLVRNNTDWIEVNLVTKLMWRKQASS